MLRGQLAQGSPDGRRAVAVARGSNELWVYDLADVFAPAEVIALPEGEVLGSLALGVRAL